MCAQASWSAENVLGRLAILDATFVPVTPWWGGGPSGYTTRFPSAGSIVGRVRWFLRTVYNRFCAEPGELYNYRASMEFVDEIIGSTESASSYLFRVEERERRYEVPPGVREIPRVKLATLRKKGGREGTAMEGDRGDVGLSWTEGHENVPVWGSSFRMIVRMRANSPKGSGPAVAGATLLTLAYIGAGKAASRGFGRFYPDMSRRGPAQGMPSRDVRVQAIAEHIWRGEYKEAFSKYYELFKKEACVDKSPRVNDWRASAVPLAPIVGSAHPERADVITEVPYNGNVIQALVDLGRCFMGTTWRSCGIDDVSAYTRLLGRPRFRPSDALRRISAVVGTPVPLPPISSGAGGPAPSASRMLLLPFMSLDDHVKKGGLTGGAGYAEHLMDNLSKVCGKVRRCASGPARGWR
ncbi:MAG: type III-B CRISPR module RAMP protein Cmr1 [Anaerolineae bacterium]|jgi:CRISPR type III-B/RAMP module RAMP protein Cmr1